MNGQRPFFRQLPCHRVERFKQTHGIGEDHAAAVQALDGVGGVHNLQGSLRKLEHGADEVLAVAPVVLHSGYLAS